MFNFGMDGYLPRWLSGLPTITATHAHRLRGLVGRRLTSSWLVWDCAGHEWFPDWPVLLDFAGEQVEINHQKFDDLSITWNSANPAHPINHGHNLAWRDDASPDLAVLHGLRLETIELLEYTVADLAHGMVAVGFGFPAGWLTIYNALDQNGLDFTLPRPCYRRHPLGR